MIENRAPEKVAAEMSLEDLQEVERLNLTYDEYLFVKKASEEYSKMNFKELLAACPLDGIDLTRSEEPPQNIDFDVFD